MVQAARLRQSFLEFFEARGHTVVTSSPLVPQNDPTLLFTNAGMVQFKDLFLGRAGAPYRRAASSQKCLRVSGKHNDLEEVGRTARHNTFFEMLGNFSFGDYFKAEAIGYAWEYLSEVAGLPQDRLYVSIFRDDEEAAALWQELTPVPPERILRLGENDNFWSMGETGPCGPCSEILLDRGEDRRCDAATCAIGHCDCDRWLELWNLVFMQYDRDEEGSLTPLPAPSIDTGMGLERLAAVLQGAENVFETDLLRPIITAVEEESGHTYRSDETGMPFRVIADHMRACTFLIADGVIPANEGRGYVLRRILRRAVRFGTRLDQEEPFLHALVPVVGQLMGEAYPDVLERGDFIARVMQSEEERFHRTLKEGVQRLEVIIDAVRDQGEEIIQGREAFLLYDTYGFPLDLSRDMAAEAGLTVDEDGFQQAMEAQRRRSRQATEGGADHARVTLGVAESEFLGYDRHAVDDAEVLGLLTDGEAVTAVTAGDPVQVVLDRTPFYAEAGGQVGDEGHLTAGSARLRVTDTQRDEGGRIIHHCTVEAGELGVGERVRAQVNAARRAAICRNHTATHLLHRVLKRQLGEHANQAGSLVAADRLRFDFTHFDALSDERLRAIEDEVNARIYDGLPVQWYRTSLDEARSAGAMALFGEKYGDWVRVVQIGDYSLELCGGTHVRATDAVGLFKITHESSVGANLRRLQAVTALAALERLRQLEALVSVTARRLGGAAHKLPDRAQELADELRRVERELDSLRQRLAGKEAEELLAGVRQIGDYQVLVAEAAAAGMDDLLQLADRLRAHLGSGVLLLGSATADKALFVAAVSPDLTERGLHAGTFVGQVAEVAGGGGGGRPELAQAGGRQPERVADALSHGTRLLEEKLTS